jgi:integrase
MVLQQAYPKEDLLHASMPPGLRPSFARKKSRAPQIPRGLLPGRVIANHVSPCAKKKEKTMSVYRINGVWHYRFMYKGAVIKRSTRQGNHRVAVEMEAQHRSAKAKGDAGLGEKPSTPTLACFLVDRIRPYAANKKATTARWFRDGLGPLLSYKPLASRALDTITSETIADYCAHRESLGRAVGSVNRELRVLRRSLRLAQEWGVITIAPKVKMAGKEVRRERVITEDEFARYLSCAPPLLADVVMILRETGLRPDECHRLEWPDIDFRHNRLLVRTGKTSAARRRIPLTPAVRSVFETRWQLAGTPGTGYVFPSATKTGHIDHSTTKKQHRTALKASGVREFVIYSLRHSFATRIAPHVDAWTLCKIMGWDSLSVAMTYVHPDERRVLEVFSGTEFGTVTDDRLLMDSAEINPSN